MYFDKLTNLVVDERERTNVINFCNARILRTFVPAHARTHTHTHTYTHTCIHIQTDML